MKKLTNLVKACVIAGGMMFSGEAGGMDPPDSYEVISTGEVSKKAYLEADINVSISSQHLRKGNWREAYQVAEKAVILQPENLRGNWNAMEALVEMEDVEKACEFYRDVYEICLEGNIGGKTEQSICEPLLESEGDICD